MRAGDALDDAVFDVEGGHVQFEQLALLQGQSGGTSRFNQALTFLQKATDSSTQAAQMSLML